MARNGTKADTVLNTKIEVQGDDSKIITNKEDLPALLEKMIRIDGVTVSMSVSRKINTGASNNYFMSVGIGGIKEIYEKDFEGIDKAELKKTLGSVLVKRIGNTNNFIRSCIKKEHEKDGMPIFNLGEFMSSNEVVDAK